MGRKKGKLEKNVFKMHKELFHKEKDILDRNGNVIAKPLERRQYIAFCNYRWHRGIIKNESLCLERKCRHYRKLYIDR